MGGRHVRFQAERFLEFITDFLRIAFAKYFRYINSLSVSPKSMCQLQVGIRILWVQSNGFPRQFRCTFEQGLLFIVFCEVVAVDRQGPGRECITIGGFEGFGEFGCFDEPSFIKSGTCRFNGLSARDACRENPKRDGQASQGGDLDHRTLSLWYEAWDSTPSACSI